MREVRQPTLDQPFSSDGAHCMARLGGWLPASIMVICCVLCIRFVAYHNDGVKAEVRLQISLLKTTLHAVLEKVEALEAASLSGEQRLARKSLRLPDEKMEKLRLARKEEATRTMKALVQELSKERLPYTGPMETDCQKIFLAKSEDVVWPPPTKEDIPAEMLKGYTMDGKAAQLDWYLTEQQNGVSLNWSGEKIKETVNCIKGLKSSAIPARCALRDGGITTESCDAGVGHLCSLRHNCYGNAGDLTDPVECMESVMAHQDAIQGKSVMVLGSQQAWAEAMMLALGASRVVTYEYSVINMPADIPELEYIHPAEAAKQYVAGTWKPVDAIFTFSSLEHDGLGRYGDPLNPIGDLMSIKKACCLLKPGGLLFLGFPVGPDAVVFNAHRIYGKNRLHVIFEGWEPLGVFGNFNIHGNPGIMSLTQPVFVLRKKESGC